MNKLKILKKIYNDYHKSRLDNPGSNPKINEYSKKDEVRIIKGFIERGIINPNSCKIEKYLITDSEAHSHDEEIVRILSKGDSNESIFTSEGEKYYFEHTNKNWYLRLKDKWGYTIVIDIFAFIGFVLSIIYTLKQLNCLH